MKAKPLIERFWDKAARAESGCLEWQAYRMPGKMNYGRIQIRRKFALAHRTAWELTNGPVPEGMCVLHKCDNPPCIEPTHLFLGTYADNSRDMFAKGRRKLDGENHPAAKLTWESVAAIRAAARAGERNVDIARRFAISDGHVSNLVAERAWAT